MKANRKQTDIYIIIFLGELYFKQDTAYQTIYFNKRYDFFLYLLIIRQEQT